MYVYFAWQYTVSYPELWTRVWEQMDLPKVVSSNQEALIIGPADSVDVSAIWAVGPQAWGAESRGKVLAMATKLAYQHLWSAPITMLFHLCLIRTKVESEKKKKKLWFSGELLYVPASIKADHVFGVLVKNFNLFFEFWVMIICQVSHIWVECSVRFWVLL